MPARELIRLFLRLGFTAFGGPAAHIAIMKQEVVQRRHWMMEAQFLDLLGAANLIPGPNSTEMAIYVGYVRGRWIGLVVAGVCFILPAAVIVSALAWAYLRFGALPQSAGLLYAVKPVIIAVVVQAIWGLLRPAAKTPVLIVIGIAALALAAYGANPLFLLSGAGALSGLIRWIRPPHGRERPTAVSLAVLLAVSATMALVPTALTRLATPSAGTPFGLWPLFVFFLKVGGTLYGSGYVLLAFLRDGLVHQWHWLTEAQLLDATAVGQVTPGPVFTTATFIGYILGGPIAAIVATLGIFLPSFVFVAVSGPLVPRLRNSPLTGAFLDGVNVAALALITAVMFQLARAALVDTFTIALAAVSAVLLVRYRVNSAWLIASAAVLGLATSWFGK
jgi:chromate transporter